MRENFRVYFYCKISPSRIAIFVTGANPELDLGGHGPVLLSFSCGKFLNTILAVGNTTVCRLTYCTIDTIFIILFHFCFAL